MKRDTQIQLAAAVVFVLSMLGASAIMPRINASASEHQLRYTDEAVEGAPLAVTIASSVGVLRGVIVNYLWIRADKLKEDGKFFESYSIAEWITQLQPRFAKVWAFQAWNMAYNISVATHTKEERWKWVQDGIRLIREQGIRYNPNDMMLYKELAWYFLHKIGGYTDDAHYYYKQQLAHEWQGLLGDIPYDAEVRREHMREIAEAPQHIETLYERVPATRDLARTLRRMNFELDKRLLFTVEQLNAIDTSYLAQRTGLSERLDEMASLDEIPQDARSTLVPVFSLKPVYEDDAYQAAWPALLAFTRKKVLRDEYNMEPAYMAQCMDKYGPLDWRAPGAHVIYWASRGVDRGLTRTSQVDFDRINTDRLIFHATQQLKFTGRIYYDYLTREISWGQDLRFIPIYEKTFLEVFAREMTDPNRVGRGAADGYIAGYRNFLIDTVREYWVWGEYDRAREKYRQLRTTAMFFEPDKPDRFTRPIEQFIIEESVDRFTSPQVARNYILGSLSTALRLGLARGDSDLFRTQVNQARGIHEYFMEEVGSTFTHITGQNRLAFPPFEDLLRAAFMYVMTTDANTTLEERLRLWNSQNPMIQQLKLQTYDDVVDSMRTSYEQRMGSPEPFDSAFPPPPGLEEYRRREGIPAPTGEGGGPEMERK